jgi:hypothetical protein
MPASELSSVMIASQEAVPSLKHAYFDCCAVIQLPLKPYLYLKPLPISSSIRPLQFEHPKHPTGLDNVAVSVGTHSENNHLTALCKVRGEASDLLIRVITAEKAKVTQVAKMRLEERYCIRKIGSGTRHGSQPSTNGQRSSGRLQPLYFSETCRGTTECLSTPSEADTTGHQSHSFLWKHLAGLQPYGSQRNDVPMSDG